MQKLYLNSCGIQKVLVTLHSNQVSHHERWCTGEGSNLLQAGLKLR